MLKKKPKVFITRRLPRKIETRMMELFDTTLNEKDVLLNEITRSNSIDRSKEIVNYHYEKALYSLLTIPESNYRKALESIITISRNRI